jgi:hypothetical protein
MRHLPGCRGADPQTYMAAKRHSAVTRLQSLTIPEFAADQSGLLAAIRY